jgi:hypothetical protein
MARLARLADAFSASDAMSRAAELGVSGPAKSPFGYAWTSSSVPEDGDEDGEFDGTRAESRGGRDLIGEPRSVLGGGGDIARSAARALRACAFESAPRGNDPGPPSRASRDWDECVSEAARTYDPRGVSGRLKELAEYASAPVLRGSRGGGGAGGAGEAAERVAFLARMATLQAERGPLAKARRRRPSKHLLVSAEVLAELELVGGYGGAA